MDGVRGKMEKKREAIKKKIMEWNDYGLRID